MDFTREQVIWYNYVEAYTICNFTENSKNQSDFKPHHYWRHTQFTMKIFSFKDAHLYSRTNCVNNNYARCILSDFW